MTNTQKNIEPSAITKCVRRPYYILVNEWNYPTTSGQWVEKDTYKSLHEALKDAKKFCEDEIHHFEEATNCDPLWPEEYHDDDTGMGVIITAKNGLDEWYFACRVVEMFQLG